MDLPSGKKSQNIGAQMSLHSITRKSWKAYGWQGFFFYPLNEKFADNVENPNRPGWLRFIFTIMSQFMAPLIYCMGFLLTAHLWSTVGSSPTTAADMGIRAVLVSGYLAIGYFAAKLITHDTRYRVYMMPANALASVINKEVGLVVAFIHAGLILAAAAAAGVICKMIVGAPLSIYVINGAASGAAGPLANATVTKTLFWLSTSLITTTYIFINGFWNQDKEKAEPPSPNVISIWSYVATALVFGFLTAAFFVAQLTALDGGLSLTGLMATGNHFEAVFWMCISLFAAPATAIAFYLIKSLLLNTFVPKIPGYTYEDQPHAVDLPGMSNNIATSARLRKRVNVNLDN